MRRRFRLVGWGVFLLLVIGPRDTARPGVARAGGYPVDHCGWIERRGDCHVFSSLNTKYREHVIDVGARPDSLLAYLAHVVGSSEPCSVECQNYTYTRCVVDPQIAECTPVDLGCGVLDGPYKDGTCWLWNSIEYGSLLTARFGYAAGDTIHIMGLIDPYGQSICGMGDGSLVVWAHAACGDTITVVDDASWGEIKRRFQP